MVDVGNDAEIADVGLVHCQEPSIADRGLAILHHAKAQGAGPTGTGACAYEASDWSVRRGGRPPSGLRTTSPPPQEMRTRHSSIGARRGTRRACPSTKRRQLQACRRRCSRPDLVWRSAQLAPQSEVPWGQAHAPAVQAWPVAHAVPQAPQLWALLPRFTQAPVQSVSPEGQLAAQAPAAHTCPLGQAIPQPPQSAGSLVVSTHAPLHEVRPVVHAQAPPAQSEPVPQACPHAPQFAGSLPVSTQAAPQAVPVPQPQAPMAHDCAEVQAVPQAPQLAGSTVTFTHPPAQSVSPLGQLAAQTPSAQTCPLGQAVPQAPQFAGSVESETQAPPHEVSPGGAVALARHAGAPLGAGIHAAGAAVGGIAGGVDALAAAGDEARRAHAGARVADLPAAASHGAGAGKADSLVVSTVLCPASVYGAPHAATQAPAWQKAVAPPHASPQLPQFCGSEASEWQKPPQSWVPAGQVHEPCTQAVPWPQAWPQAPQFGGIGGGEHAGAAAGGGPGGRAGALCRRCSSPPRSTRRCSPHSGGDRSGCPRTRCRSS